MARKLIVEIVGDERSYLRAAQNTVATNAKLQASFARVGVSAEQSAAATVAAAVKSQAAQRERIAATTRFAMIAPTPQLKEAAFAQAATQQAKLDRELGNVQKATRGSTLATAAYSTSVGRTTRETEVLAQRTAVAERDLNKMTRGVLSGSGILGRFSRSLAFASSGFIAFATGAVIIRDSITGAEDLEKAQRSLSVAIQHTGGDLRKLLPRYVATAKAAAQFGMTQADATTGLARATVITGNAGAAQRAYQEALVISKATGKDFNTVLVATSKGQEGIVTSLRRYGILVDSTTKGTEQFTLVMKRFGGQAEANTTHLQQLGATFTNTLAAIGKELLPTFNRLAESVSNWLTKMNDSGRLQKDVNSVVKDAGDVFRFLGGAIRGVDRLTGSFANTLKLLIGLKIASVVAGWVGSLKLLAASWGIVTGAAGAAGAAQTAALGAGSLRGGAAAAGTASTIRKELPAAARGTGGGLLPLLFGANAARLLKGGGTDPKIINRIKAYTEGVTKTGAEAGRSGGRIALLARGLRGLTGVLIGLAVLPKELDALSKIAHNLTHPDFGAIPRQKSQLGNFVVNNSEIGVSRSGRLLLADRTQFNTDQLNAIAKQFGLSLKQLEEGVRPTPELARRLGVTLKELNDGILSVLDSGAVITPQLRKFPRTRNIVPPAFQVPGFPAPPANLPKPLPRVTNAVRSFGKAIRVWANFQLTLAENISQARAALTRGTGDDVAAAKEVVARIKRAIDQGHLQGKSLLAALQIESSALSTIWSAEQAAAQKRAADAQAAKDRIVQQIENAIDPLKLEVALSRAQAFGKPILPRLRALLRAAEEGLRKAIAAHNLQLEKEALDQITSLKQQIKDARTTPTVTFQLSQRLQLALARDEALGIDPTKDLLKAKAALLKFIRTHRKNFAALTDAYNQLASINQQLGSTASSALGLFKQASTRALTAGLNLTAEQRKALRARLSQLGPGGTVPGSGVGAAGFAIDPNTGRPLVLDHRTRRQQGRVGGAGGGSPIRVDNQIDLNVYIDGHHVEATVTKRQQKRRRRNPGQRRGPNAGLAGA